MECIAESQGYSLIQFSSSLLLLIFCEYFVNLYFIFQGVCAWSVVFSSLVTLSHSKGNKKYQHVQRLCPPCSGPGFQSQTWLEMSPGVLKHGRTAIIDLAAFSPVTQPPYPLLLIWKPGHNHVMLMWYKPILVISTRYVAHDTYQRFAETLTAYICPGDWAENQDHFIVSVIFQAKMWNICWFQLFKCYKSWLIWFITVNEGSLSLLVWQKKQFEKRHLGLDWTIIQLVVKKMCRWIKNENNMMVNDFNQVPALLPAAGLCYHQVTKKQN